MFANFLNNIYIYILLKLKEKLEIERTVKKLQIERTIKNTKISILLSCGEEVKAFPRYLEVSDCAYFHTNCQLQKTGISREI